MAVGFRDSLGFRALSGQVDMQGNGPDDVLGPGGCTGPQTDALGPSVTIIWPGGCTSQSTRVWPGRYCTIMHESMHARWPDVTISLTSYIEVQGSGALEPIVQDFLAAANQAQRHRASPHTLNPK